ncbi:hypothetical protein HWD28_gp004 [Salmonella phage atrejo]|uniref:Putative membrane protein n=1 Tax=Salmonella phage atrejo TaxID=2713277 RepID=A0A6G8RJT7_9CAUD|nr:hypothetical protein HWD28_gp004 [Salmonella phage atrejo]QIO01652.1 putative membrane protein [Salmonella phage atrejo]
MVIFRSILASILGAILSLFAIAFGVHAVIIGAVIAAFSYMLGCMTSKGE